jgi:ribose 5-phosphate isomerase B
MKIAISADHAGFDLKKILINKLKESGQSVTDYGTNSTESIDYPDYAYKAAKSVADGENELGIIICGSGVGVSITANKVKGIRAANCFNTEMASLARQHNNANIICLGARFIDEELATNMIDVFIKTEFEGGRHERRVEKIHNLTGC